MPTIARRKQGATIDDVPLAEVSVGDVVLVFPQRGVPGRRHGGRRARRDGRVVSYRRAVYDLETPGSAVLSGRTSMANPLSRIHADRLAGDSRDCKIMKVMKASQQERPKIRRLGDRSGAWYTPMAVAMAAGAWIDERRSVRFLAVMVVATPCPLLIAIPVAVIGSISLAAKRAIVVRDPAVLETVSTCRTIIFDKTGTLTYGRPELVDQIVVPGRARRKAVAGGQLGTVFEAPAGGGDRPGGTEGRGRSFTGVDKSVSRPGRDCAVTVPGHEVRLTEPQATSRSSRTLTNGGRRRSAGWSASSWSMVNMPRRIVFAMGRGVRACRLLVICAAAPHRPHHAAVGRPACRK